MKRRAPNNQVDDEEQHSQCHEQVLLDVETNCRPETLHPRQLPSLPRLVKDGKDHPCQQERRPVHRVPHPSHPEAATAGGWRGRILVTDRVLSFFFTLFS